CGSPSILLPRRRSAGDFVIFGLEVKARREANRIVGAVGVRAPACVHMAEVRRVARIDRAQPPPPCASVGALFYPVSLLQEDGELEAVRLIRPPFILWCSEEICCRWQPERVFVFLYLAADGLHDLAWPDDAPQFLGQ